MTEHGPESHLLLFAEDQASQKRLFLSKDPKQRDEQFEILRRFIEFDQNPERRTQARKKLELLENFLKQSLPMPRSNTDPVSRDQAGEIPSQHSASPQASNQANELATEAENSLVNYLQWRLYFLIDLMPKEDDEKLEEEKYHILLDLLGM